MELIQRLQEIDCSQIKRFSFDGIDTYSRVANVHDPDTITIIFEFDSRMIKANVRLEGFDAPELHSSIETEADACKKGNVFLKPLIEDKVIRVILGKFDKYHRIMAQIHTLEPIEDNITCVNDYLLMYQYVRAYDGGKKLKWSQEELDSVGTKKRDLISNQ